ncbi:hypothetical protein [Streptomyces cinereospinus]|uniref:Gas vesicle protein n=1 Tax=Streptomyces cinereospinus TaxID=285561 RepID=A0ABV5N0I1_9ACTN
MSAADHHPTAAGERAQPAVDVHLEMLLRLVEAQSGAGIAVTLTTAGGIVSGSLVGSRVWAERWEDVVAEAVGGRADAEQLVLLPRTVQDSLEEGSLHAFVHLVDVTFLSATATPTSPLWRGRVSDVSGWSLGAPD